MPTPELFNFHAILAPERIINTKGIRVRMKYFRRKTKTNALDGETNLEDRSLRSREQPLSGTNSLPEDLSVSLRAEMLPASEISPDMRKFRTTRFNPRKLVAVLGFIILMGVGWFFYAGPGRPVLESVLSALARQPQLSVTATPTIPVQTEIVVASKITIRPSNTPTRTPFLSPSATLAAVLSTPTIEPSPTSVFGCVDVLTITMEDVGKTLCVRGVIEYFEARQSGFLIAFSNEKGAMYWVSYDLVWEPAKKSLCVEVTGEVMQIANTPVIVFGYTNLPVVCASP